MPANQAAGSPVRDGNAGELESPPSAALPDGSCSADPAVICAHP